MRVKLSTSDVGLSNEDIFTSRVELLDAYNEVLEQGINMNYASALVDNMLVGLDIVQKYNNSKDATAALESLQKIVLKSPVEITASCEGVGEALKAVWNKFVEVCKNIWNKVKEFIVKLCQFISGGYKNTINKTKLLIERVKNGKGSKENLSVALEGYGGRHDDDVISCSDVKCFTRYIEQSLLIADYQLKVLNDLDRALSALLRSTDNGSEAMKPLIESASKTSSDLYSKLAHLPDDVSSLLFFSTTDVCGWSVSNFRPVNPEYYGESIDNWDANLLVSMLQGIEKASPMVVQANEKIKAITNHVQLDPAKWGSLVETYMNKIAAEKGDNTPKSVMIQAKMLLSQMVKVASNTASLVNQAVKLHNLMNTNLETVASKLGF